MGVMARPVKLSGQDYACLESRETKLEILRAMLSEGEKSGFADYSYEKLIQKLDGETH